MNVALLFAVASVLGTLRGCRADGAADAPSSPPPVVAEPPRPTVKAEAPAAIPPAPAAIAPEPAPSGSVSREPVEVSWSDAAAACEGREACLAAAARIPKDEPPDVAAIVRAKANGAEGRCFYEAIMAAANDDAQQSCDADARHAGTPADARLIRGVPRRAASAWHRSDELANAGRSP